MSDDALAISVSQLTKRYPKSVHNSVDGIDLQVKKGEIFGFLGPNGAGKTTTIKILTTMLFPSSGSAVVSGYDVTSHSQDVRSSIGVVFQTASLDNKLTVEENLRSHAILYGVTPFSFTYNGTSPLYKQRVEELLELVGLSNRRQDIVESLSGGLRRRLDIAKALLHTPQILFLDEPTTGLDPQSRKTLWEHLERLQDQHGFTIFLTTQYLEEAEICDRISIIDGGKILVTDTPTQLKKHIGDEFLSLLPKDACTLTKELTAMKLEFRQTRSGHFFVTLGKKKAQSILREIETELAEITIKKPTLDDVFIQLTGKDMHE